jgi:hypothetical protein
MTSFQSCYNLTKHVPKWDSWLGLHSTSWAVAAIGPLARVTYMVSSNHIMTSHFIWFIIYDSKCQDLILEAPHVWVFGHRV